VKLAENVSERKKKETNSKAKFSLYMLRLKKVPYPWLKAEDCCITSSPTLVRRSRIALSASHVSKASSPIAVYRSSGAEASRHDRLA
jgi:hypothetical protein